MRVFVDRVCEDVTVVSWVKKTSSEPLVPKKEGLQGAGDN